MPVIPIWGDLQRMGGLEYRKNMQLIAARFTTSIVFMNDKISPE
jgi:hypothetical protein